MLTKVEVPVDAVVRALWGWGYFSQYPHVSDAVRGVTHDEVKSAITQYQEFNGLVADGVIGPQTVHKMTSPYRCGMPDLIGTTDCKWPMFRIAYMCRLNLGLSNAIEAYKEAANQWNEVANFELFQVTDSSIANIVADDYGNRRDQFGSRGGVLADSQMPCARSPRQQIPQRYDTAENWTYAMLVAVACHELGHALGLGHLAAGALMAPYYDPRITKPQMVDIKAMEGLYGAKPTTPQSPDADVPFAQLWITHKGQKYAATGKMKIDDGTQRILDEVLGRLN